MRYVYFTKFLQSLDVKGLASFAKEVGLDGLDLVVRPGYPVNPDNALTALPEAVKVFRDEGLFIGLISAPTDMSDADSKTAQVLFDAAAKAGVPFVKTGYFLYRPPFDEALANARKRLGEFSRLAAKTGVRACYHTHSGNFLGNNAASLRLLLQDSDPHHIGAYFDTGHTAINGGPPRMEIDILRSFLSLVAIKDMAWEHRGNTWAVHIVPAGQGIVPWGEVGQALKQARFNGTVSLHAEYEEIKGAQERKKAAKEELAFLKKHLG
jgi:sugar phosphate isomerase/epimerase